jgi:RNA-directed DNA polymerase
MSVDRVDRKGSAHGQSDAIDPNVWSGRALQEVFVDLVVSGLASMYPVSSCADDRNIYVRSERAGQRVMGSISRFITQKLKLKVNEAKSAVARPQERKFLGFSFTAGPDIKRTIAPKSLERFKQRIRDVTRRAKGVSIKTTMEELATYMRGWRGYFGFCETPEVLIALTRWVRLRLRAALWRQWKTPRRRRAALIANGVSEWAARKTAGSGRGPWYLARSRAISTGLSNAYFKSLGLLSLLQSC